MLANPDSLEGLFHTLYRMHHGYMRYELERRGLRKLSNPKILFYLRMRHGQEPVTQTEIAHRLGITPPTVATSIKRMERAGLLTKVTDEEDLRRNHIALTEHGVQLVDECVQAEESVSRQIFKNFSPEDREALKGLIQRMIQNMQDIGVRRPGAHCPDSPRECPRHSGASGQEPLEDANERTEVML